MQRSVGVKDLHQKLGRDRGVHQHAIFVITIQKLLAAEDDQRAMPALRKLQDCTCNGLQSLLEVFAGFRASMLENSQVADVAHTFKPPPDLRSEHNRDRKDQSRGDRVDQPGKTR